MVRRSVATSYIRMVTAPQLAGAFTRRLFNDERTLIESRCKSCGARIVGSAMHGLQEQEIEHCEHCPARKVRHGGRKPPRAS